MRGASREGDGVGGSVDQLGDQLAHPVRLVLGPMVAIRPVERGLDHLLDGGTPAMGHGRHPRVVHVNVALAQRDEVTGFKWIHLRSYVFWLSQKTITNGCNVVM